MLNNCIKQLKVIDTIKNFSRNFSKNHKTLIATFFTVKFQIYLKVKTKHSCLF